MNLSRFFIDRPIFAGVLSVLMVIAGLVALRGLPISEYPEVAPQPVEMNAAAAPAPAVRKVALQS